MNQLLNCRSCRRLALNLDRLRTLHPDWHNRPVPGIGPEDAPLLILGLAPGKSGANRTGKPFVGDKSSSWLSGRLKASGCLDEAGHPINVRISNAVKCLPPANRPTLSEINRCIKKWTATEINQTRVILALGVLAHNSVLRALKVPLNRYQFGHGNQHKIQQTHLFDSFHPSPLNTQTGRLSTTDFDRVLQSALAFSSSIN